MSQLVHTGGLNTYAWWNCWPRRWVLAELLALLAARDVTADESWRSEYLCLVKLLTQAVSSERVVSNACWKRFYSWRVLGGLLVILVERDVTRGEYVCKLPCGPPRNPFPVPISQPSLLAPCIRLTPAYCQLQIGGAGKGARSIC